MIEKLDIERLSHEGRGIGHHNDRTVFAMGALAHESVDVRVLRKHKGIMEAVVTSVHQASDQRVEPLCRHFLSCGGCALQHLSTGDQLQLKLKALREQVSHAMPWVQPEWVSPIQEATTHYRRKARLSVKYVAKKDQVLIGFREVDGRWVQAMQQCVILPEGVDAKLHELAQCLHGFSIRDRIPQIELFITDGGQACLMRHLAPFASQELNTLVALMQSFGWQLWLQPKGPNTVHRVYPQVAEPLTYALKNFDLSIEFLPGDFIQVHAGVNDRMIVRALDWLGVTPGMRCLDLFCGLGNFTLPLAKSGAHVSAVEGAAEMVKRAELNAMRHGLSVDYFVEDLQQAQWQGGLGDASV